MGLAPRRRNLLEAVADPRCDVREVEVASVCQEPYPSDLAADSQTLPESHIDTAARCEDESCL